MALSRSQEKAQERRLTRALDKARASQPLTAREARALIPYVLSLETQLQQAQRQVKDLGMDLGMMREWLDRLTQEWNAHVAVCNEFGLEIVGDAYDATTRRWHWSWSWRSRGLEGCGKGYEDNIQAFRGALAWLLSQVGQDQQP